ncbi:MAG: TetR/AcrR family transcriptional regulator [Deltaproteobacteria bacterium]|nr:MAG: TetR/AcrR family transcriptional regulator [Deltaproteobacteria bacterium]
MPERDTREALLDAVGELLNRDGLSGLSLRKAAAAAGVSHGAPGALFGDFAGMLTAYACRAFHRLGARMTDELATATTGPEALAATGRGYLAFAREEPEAFLLMFRRDLLRPHDPELIAARARSFSVLTAALQRAVDEERLPRERLPLVRIASWALVHGVAGLRLADAFPSHAGGGEAELARAVTDLFAHSVLAAAEASE